jgi:alpha-tubulin suppressor-like RCC1 family protein
MSRQQPKSISNNTSKNQKQVSSLQDGGVRSPKINVNKKEKSGITLSSEFQLNVPSLTYFEKKLHDGIYSGGSSSVFTFGSNEMGQLGKEVEVNSPFSFNPILINSLSPYRIISISAGDGHSVCVSKDGVVFAWGASACGQLGLDDNESMPRDAEGYPFQPIPIPVKLMAGIKIKEVACGDAHTLAMTTEGKVFSWGGAGCGQLGHPNIHEMPKDADNCPYQPYPKIIETLKPLTMIHIACGKAHSLSIDSTGSLYTWGAGACGQLGVEDIHNLPVDDDGYPYQPVPKYLKSLKGQNITLGVCGDVHTLVLNDKGEVYSFGGGSFGQLGLGPINKMPLDSDRYPYMPIPTKVEILNDMNIVNIACGDSHSMAVDNEGRLYTWGAAACGQLGLDSLVSMPKDGEGNPYQPEPKVVPFFENFKVLSVSCGEAHTLVLCEGGIVYSFGGSSCGQLGYPEIKENKIGKSLPKSLQSRVSEVFNLKYEKPRLITSLLGKNVTKMACGGVHNLLLCENQTSMINNLYLMLKNETFTDLELVLRYGETTKISIKCHKYVLISKSNYFYNIIYGNVNKSHNEKEISSSKNYDAPSLNKIFIYGNYNTIQFKTIFEYIYLDDMSFLNSIELNSTNNSNSINNSNNSSAYLDILVDYLKLAKLFELKILQNEIEIKIKSTLSRYNEALSSVNSSINVFNCNSSNSVSNCSYNINTSNLQFENNFSVSLNDAEIHREETDSIQNQFKGLFFLPNGNALLMLNEEMIENVLKTSLILNFNKGDKEISNREKECLTSSNAVVKSSMLLQSMQSHPQSLQSQTQKKNETMSQAGILKLPKSNTNIVVPKRINQILFTPVEKDLDVSKLNLDHDVDESLLDFAENKGGNALNKTISNFGITTKQLFENLMSIGDFDIYDVLVKFNLIDQDIDINLGGTIC